jgi:hypothetical protein
MIHLSPFELLIRFFNEISLIKSHSFGYSAKMCFVPIAAGYGLPQTARHLMPFGGEDLHPGRVSVFAVYESNERPGST